MILESARVFEADMLRAYVHVLARKEFFRNMV